MDMVLLTRLYLHVFTLRIEYTTGPGQGASPIFDTMGQGFPVFDKHAISVSVDMRKITCFCARARTRIRALHAYSIL